MQVFPQLVELKQKYNKIVVALGMFDGVHIGHQQIIRRAVALAREIHGTALVFTFQNHPLSTLAPSKVPLQIASGTLRERLMTKLGVDVLVTIPFTEEFSHRSPEDFLALLQRCFSPHYVVTGPNYTFGAKGAGNQEMLKELGGKYGFQAVICPTILQGERPVSSTRIRQQIAKGDLDTVNAFLGYPFTIVDTVIHGDQRGRTIGFPTANLAIPDTRVMLPNGVYAARVIYEGKNYWALANIGDNPTFEGCNRRIEVNIQEFHQDIYGKSITVEFLARLRDEVRFSGIEALKAQLYKDKEAAVRYWQ